MLKVLTVIKVISHRSISYSRSTSRYSFSGSDVAPGPASPRSPKKKAKLKKEKRRKQKKEKKQKVKDNEQSIVSEPAAVRDSFMLPSKPPVSHLDGDMMIFQPACGPGLRARLNILEKGFAAYIETLITSSSWHSMLLMKMKRRWNCC